MPPTPDPAREGLIASANRRRWRLIRLFIWIFSGVTGFSVLVTVLAVMLGPETEPDIGGLRPPKVGETQYIGRGNCDRAVKQLLRDPDSFQRIATQIVDVKAGEGWVAQVNFRSRNGFGGYGEGTAYCVFNGTSYRALLDEQL